MAFFQILGLSDGFVTNRTIPIEANELQYNVRDLSPGASYQVQAFTVFDNRESLAYTSRNFTTSKCIPFQSIKFFLQKIQQRISRTGLHQREEENNTKLHTHNNRLY